MKIISYKVLFSEINTGTEEEPNIEKVYTNAEIECPTQAIFDANYPIAEKEAVGEIVVNATSFCHRLVMTAEHFYVLLIVMNVKNIRYHMVMTAGIHTRAGGINGLCCVVDRRQNAVILFSSVPVPGFVKGTPANQRRGIEIPVQNVHPRL